MKEGDEEYEVVFHDEGRPISWGSFASLDEAVSNVLERVKVPDKGSITVRRVKDWTIRREIKGEKVKRLYS